MSVRFLVPAVALTISIGIGAAACSSSSELTTAPAPAKCQVALAMPPGSVSANGGAGTVTVTTDAECAWSAAVAVPWITGLTPASGQGAGQVQFEVAPNPAPAPRQGMITVSGQQAQVTQSGAACHFDLSPVSQAVAATGGTGSVAVSTLSGCAWTATSGAAWVTITAGASATASGVVQFSAAANSGAARAGSIAIGDQTFQVTQAAGTQPGVPCVFTLDTTSQSVGAGGGTATTTVRTDPTCSWTAASNVSWLTVSGNGAGAGNQLVSLTVAANTGSSRVGTATIAGQTFTVTEAGSCSASVTPSSQSLGSGGGPGSESVVTAAGCAWTASTGDPWLTITAGASGNGNGTVNFTAAANGGPSRTGNVDRRGRGHQRDAGRRLRGVDQSDQRVGRRGRRGRITGHGDGCRRLWVDRDDDGFMAHGHVRCDRHRQRHGELYRRGQRRRQPFRHHHHRRATADGDAGRLRLCDQSNEPVDRRRGRPRHAVGRDNHRRMRLDLGGE